jgi:hypothetical protein
MWIFNEKKNPPNKLFRKCNGYSKECFESDFGVRHSFCVPQPWMELDMFILFNKDWLHNFKSLECGHEYDDFAFWLLGNELNGSGFMTKDFVT